MVVAFTQNIVHKEGKSIVLPVWSEGDAKYGELAHPDVYVLDTYQKWPIGTKFVDGDRVYFYGYINTVEGTSTKCGQGMFNIATGRVATQAAAIEPIGETEINMLDTVSTVNQYAGGYMMGRTHPTITYRILSNTVQDGTNAVFTLERGLVVAYAASQTIRLYENPWRKLCSTVNAGRRDVSCMGIAPIVPVASRYGWFQTWGPANVLGGDEEPGGANSLRMGCFNIDGTLVWDGWSSTEGQQMAGYIINDNDQASYVASWFVYLMIAR